MRKLLVLTAILCVIMSLPAFGSTIWYFDRVTWTAALGGNIAGNVDFEGIAPAGSYVNVPNPSNIGGVTFEQMNATTPYFIVVDSAYPGGNYNWGTGDSAQVGKRSYSGLNSFVRVSYPSMFGAGFDLFTVFDNSNPIADMVTVTTSLSTGDSNTVATPSTGFTTVFIGFISDVPVNYIDFFAQDNYPNFDNFSYSTTPVPEPASLMLVGAGLLILGLTARKK